MGRSSHPVPKGTSFSTLYSLGPLVGTIHGGISYASLDKGSPPFDIERAYLLLDEYAIVIRRGWVVYGEIQQTRRI